MLELGGILNIIYLRLIPNYLEMIKEQIWSQKNRIFFYFISFFFYMVDDHGQNDIGRSCNLQSVTVLKGAFIKSEQC